jgi:NADH pyrophosphatase NudC (nudix superfamily)
MEIAALLLTLGVIILVGLYLYAPFLGRSSHLATAEEHEISALMAERDRVVNSLQELEFDFKLGKIPDEDYPVQRASLLQKGADVLRKLDELTSRSAQTEQGGHLEQAIAAHRKNTSPSEAELSDDDLESLIIARRKTRKEKTAGFCPKCGKPVMASDRFCPSCGKPLA